MSSELTHEIRTLWNRLEQIGDEHEELYDADVQEALTLVLHRHFVWGEAFDQAPVAYGLFTEEGNLALGRAVEGFLNEAPGLCDDEDIAPGQARLDLLQDESIESDGGETYDTFLADAEEPYENDELPERLFEEPDYETLGEKAGGGYDPYDDEEDDETETEDDED